MDARFIVLFVYLVGVLITFLCIRKLNISTYEKVFGSLAWPCTLILYIVHRIHNGL